MPDIGDNLTTIIILFIGCVTFVAAYYIYNKFNSNKK